MSDGPMRTEWRDQLLSHVDEIYRFIRASSRSVHDAEDLTQDVFTQAIAHREQMTGTDTRAWLYQIARNRLTTQWRRKSTEAHVMQRIKHDQRPMAGTPSAIAEMETTDVSSAAWQAIQKLDDKEREALQLKFSRLYTNQQIAELLGVTPGNLGVLIHRALTKVRARMKEMGHDLHQ
jgi:RNA polymerase sigma factor (sigma-70 family)